MPVIGDCPFESRVNVRPTNRGIRQQNYGLFHDLSGIPPEHSPWNAIAGILQREIRSGRRGPCPTT